MLDPTAMSSAPQDPLHEDVRPSEEWQEWRDKVRVKTRDEIKERKALRKVESKMMSQKARASTQRPTK